MSEELLERYFRGETTSEEERALRRADPAGEPALGMLFAGMEALARERMPVRRRSVFRRMRTPLRTAAIAALVAAGIVVAAHRFGRPYCYIDGVAVRDADRAMEATLYLEQLDRFDRAVDLFDALMND